MVHLISTVREKIKNLADWENSPTTFKAPYITSSAECLAKFAMKTATDVISSTPVVAVATAVPFVAAPIAYAYPQVRLVASAVTVGFTAGSAGLWFLRKNLNAGAKEAQDRLSAEKIRETQKKELQVKKLIVDDLGGEAAIAPARAKFPELATGLLEFREESFPIDKAIVQSVNSKRHTVFGLRVVDKATKEVHYVSVSYMGGKLQIESPATPDLHWSASQFSQIAQKRHARLELVPPQGKELTLLQQRLAPVEKMVGEHDRKIKGLEQSNAELRAQVAGQTEIMKQLVESLREMQKEMAAMKGTTPQLLEPIAPKKRIQLETVVTFPRTVSDK